MTTNTTNIKSTMQAVLNNATNYTLPPKEDHFARIEWARDVILQALLYSDELDITAYLTGGVRISGVNDIIDILIRTPEKIDCICDSCSGAVLWDWEGDY